MIFGLLISGITAFPLQSEVQQIARGLNIPESASPDSFAGMKQWIARVRTGLEETNAKYPFMAYGTDWLAFAHIILAVLLIGPWRDPVRNIWVIDFSLFACVAVIPLALIAGQVRGIPIGWRCIDCSFGVIVFVPLWICKKQIQTLDMHDQTREEQ